MWGMAVVSAVLVAGCAGRGGGGADAGPTPSAAPDGDGLGAPAWAIGHWWLYGIEAGDGGEGAPTTYVVAEDQGDDWWMATDSPERAFQDQRDDISRLGPQRKADLAGSQGDDRIEFFHWPLAAGATWPTRWDGQAVTVTVDAADPTGASLTARNATQVAYTYTYDAEAGWFGELHRHGPDGQVAFSLVLLDFGGNWTGQLASWDLVSLVDDESPAGQPNLRLGGYPRLDVPAGATDLWMSYRIPCAQNGGYTVRLQPDDPAANAQAYEDSGPCAATVEFEGVAVDGPAPGTWTLAVMYGSAPTPDGSRMQLLARTLVLMPFGG